MPRVTAPPPGGLPAAARVQLAAPAARMAGVLAVRAAASREDLTASPLARRLADLVAGRAGGGAVTAAALLPPLPLPLNGGPVMRTPIPWIGLAAIAGMFLLSWLDARGWLDGPRQIRHRPCRHVCADCAQPWTPHHQCPGWLKAAAHEPVVPLHPIELPASARPRAQLTRTHQPHQLDQPTRRALPLRRRRA
jgi:hypothetical protein